MSRRTPRITRVEEGWRKADGGLQSGAVRYGHPEDHDAIFTVVALRSRVQPIVANRQQHRFFRQAYPSQVLTGRRKHIVRGSFLPGELWAHVACRTRWIIPFLRHDEHIDPDPAKVIATEIPNRGFGVRQLVCPATWLRFEVFDPLQPVRTLLFAKWQRRMPALHYHRTTVHRCDDEPVRM